MKAKLIDYKFVATNTLAGQAELERLLARGWRVTRSCLDANWLERRNEKAIAAKKAARKAAREAAALPQAGGRKRGDQ